MKFICNDCGHEFEGNDFTTECVSCNSKNIKNIANGPDIPWKKILIGLGIVLVLLLLTKMRSGSDSTVSAGLNSTECRVKFENSGATWKVVLKMVDKNGQTQSEFPDRIKKIINKSTNRPVSFDRNTGELFPCLPDTVESTFSFIFKDPTFKANDIKEHLSISGPVNPKAECPLTAEEDDFGYTTNSDNCEISIYVKSQSRKLEIEKGGIWISINGENGNYAKRTSWNPINESLKKWDVYIVCNSRKDTVALAKRNGQSYTCSPPCPSNEHQSKETDISNKIYEVLSNCDSRKALKDLSNSVAGVKVLGEIDNEKCDWATLYATVIAGCPNTMYELASPIALSKDCKSVIIKIKKKK